MGNDAIADIVVFGQPIRVTFEQTLSGSRTAWGL